MITVIDYGVGNIGAILNMLEYLGIDAQSSSSPEEILAAEKLVLPGVGAFDKAMTTLRQRGLEVPLNESVLECKTPILGVCLGMQLLARSSEEGKERGLAWVEADVRRIVVPPESGLKVPHIGWMDVSPTRASPLFPESSGPARYYFDHSYYMCCDSPSSIAATFQYGDDLCCAVQHENIFGVQFHPEKSHRFGMRLLNEFALLGRFDTP